MGCRIAMIRVIDKVVVGCRITNVILFIYNMAMKLFIRYLLEKNIERIRAEHDDICTEFLAMYCIVSLQS